jgi:hypothetical protein
MRGTTSADVYATKGARGGAVMAVDENQIVEAGFQLVAKQRISIDIVMLRN